MDIILLIQYLLWQVPTGKFLRLDFRDNISFFVLIDSFDIARCKAYADLRVKILLYIKILYHQKYQEIYGSRKGHLGIFNFLRNFWPRVTSKDLEITIFETLMSRGLFWDIISLLLKKIKIWPFSTLFWDLWPWVAMNHLETICF